MSKKILIGSIVLVVFVLMGITSTTATSCSLVANPSAGIDQFDSVLTVTFYNLPNPLPENLKADIKCGNGIVKSSTQPIDPVTNQSSMICSYTHVDTITPYEAFANWTTVNCTTIIINYDGTVNFDAWLGITNAGFTVGQAFPVNVYAKNRGTIIDNYKVVPISTSNVKARIFDDVIENVTPNRISKTEVEVTTIAIISNEKMNVTVNSTLVPTYGKVLNITVSSGMPNLTDIDIFSVLQIIILSFIVLLFSKKLVRIS